MAWTTYECGYNARLQGCFRVLCNYESEEELREWQRGWDDAALMIEIEKPVAQTTKD